MAQQLSDPTGTIIDTLATLASQVGLLGAVILLVLVLLIVAAVMFGRPLANHLNGLVQSQQVTNDELRQTNTHLKEQRDTVIAEMTRQVELQTHLIDAMNRGMTSVQTDVRSGFQATAQRIDYRGKETTRHVDEGTEQIIQMLRTIQEAVEAHRLTEEKIVRGIEVVITRLDDLDQTRTFTNPTSEYERFDN